MRPVLRSSGVAFFASMVAAVASLSRVGFTDGAPAEEWRVAVETGRAWAGLGGLLVAVAGLALAAFVEALDRLLAREGPGLPRWGRASGFAWAALFVASGTFLTAAPEIASYQAHAEGTKTVMLLGFLYLTPVSTLLGGLLALATGIGARAGSPRWIAFAGLAAGGLTLASAPIGAMGLVGNVGLGPLVLWLVAMAGAVAWLGAERAKLH